MSRPFTPVTVVGEQIAGEAAEVKRNLEAMIESVNRSNFDIGEMCFRIKSRRLYEPYTTAQEYFATLTGMKARKLQYLTRMAGVFAQLGIPRATYEALGVARCREITSLDPDAVWKNPENGQETPVADYIRLFVEQGDNIEMDTLKQHVRVLKGFIGENDLCWENLCFTRSVRDNVWNPAVEKAKALLGSAKRDDEGISQDASDARAAEIIAASFLSDVNVQMAHLEAEPEEVEGSDDEVTL